MGLGGNQMATMHAATRLTVQDLTVAVKRLSAAELREFTRWLGERRGHHQFVAREQRALHRGDPTPAPGPEVRPGRATPGPKWGGPARPATATNMPRLTPKTRKRDEPFGSSTRVASAGHGILAGAKAHYA